MFTLRLQNRNGSMNAAAYASPAAQSNRRDRRAKCPFLQEGMPYFALSSACAGAARKEDAARAQSKVLAIESNTGGGVSRR
jgi:hypothetical protein